MLCRLLRPDADLEFEPITWRPAGDEGPLGARTTAPSRAVASGRSAAPAPSEADLQSRLQAAYRQGEAAGAQAAAERLAAPLASLGQMIRELAGVGPRVRAEAELGVVELAVAIARRVLHREISTDPEALLGVVKSACARVNSRELKRLRVAEADASVLQEHRARIGLPAGLEIAADPGLAAGSAIFETARGEMDASVETQLDEIGRGLADRMRRRA